MLAGLLVRYRDDLLFMTCLACACPNQHQRSVKRMLLQRGRTAAFNLSVSGRLPQFNGRWRWSPWTEKLQEAWQCWFHAFINAGDITENKGLSEGCETWAFAWNKDCKMSSEKNFDDNNNNNNNNDDDRWKWLQNLVKNLLNFWFLEAVHCRILLSCDETICRHHNAGSMGMHSDKVQSHLSYFLAIGRTGHESASVLLKKMKTLTWNSAWRMLPQSGIHSMIDSNLYVCCLVQLYVNWTSVYSVYV